MKYENTSSNQNYGLGDYRVTCEMECREMHIYIFCIQNSRHWPFGKDVQNKLCIDLKW